MFTLLDSDAETGFELLEVRAAGVAPAGFLSNDPRVVTVANTLDDLLVHQVWRVDGATGDITKQGSLVQSLDVGGLTIASAPVRAFEDEILAPRYVATAYRFADTVRIRFYSVSGAGSIQAEGAPTDTGEDLTGVRLTSFLPNGLLLTARQGDGSTRLLVHDLQRSTTGDVKPLRIAEHVSLAGSDFEPCRQATAHATADALVARRSNAGALVVAQYRIGDLPY